MVNSGPRSEVFTTVLVNENGAVADWTAHRQRLVAHAKRLRIELPSEPPSITAESEQAGWRLARISWSAEDDAWYVKQRPLTYRDEANEAITDPAPRWNERTNGTKHGDWRPTQPLQKQRPTLDAMRPCWFMITPLWTQTEARRWCWTRTEQCGCRLPPMGRGRHHRCRP